MKEFDIYLRRRLTECNIIVYSIPFRDGLTIYNRMALESCLTHLVLQKFIAAQTGSALEAQIDELLGTVYERLHCGASLDASVEFATHYTIDPVNAGVALKTEDVKLLASAFTRGLNDLQLALAPVDASVSKSTGRGAFGMEMTQTVRGIFKYGMERFHGRVPVRAAVEEMAKQSFEAYAHTVGLEADMTSLCYLIYTAGETALGIAASVQEVDMYYSMGRGRSDMQLSAEIGEAQYTAYCGQLQSAISVLAELTASVTYFVSPSSLSAAVRAEVASVLRRYRRVTEVDVLSTVDTEPLMELDYIALEG